MKGPLDNAIIAGSRDNVEWHELSGARWTNIFHRADFFGVRERAIIIP